MTLELQSDTYLTFTRRKLKMSTRSKKIRLDMEELVLFLQNSVSFHSNKSGPSVEMISPFPLYLGTLVQTSTSLRFNAKQIGWRALILNHGEPTAVAEFAVSNGREKSTCTTFRGSDPAEALSQALAIADQLRTQAITAFSDLRFITFPGLDVTALWIFGRKPVFIPTRRGSPSRGAIAPLHGKKAFLDLLGQELRKRNWKDSSGILSSNHRNIGADINTPPHIIQT